MSDQPPQVGPGRYVVGRVTDLADGERIFVRIGGRSVGVLRIDGQFYALANRCPHQGGELCRGKVVRAVEAAKPGEYRYVDGRHFLMCPWHGWEFDVKTGQSYFDPQRTRVRSYPVAVERGAAILEGASEAGDQRIPGPYTAETFPVEIDGEYIVVVTHRPKRDPAPPASG